MSSASDQGDAVGGRPAPVQGFRAVPCRAGTLRREVRLDTPCLRHRTAGDPRDSSAVRDSSGERGSATLVGAGLIMAVLALFMIGLQLGSVVAARHRAEAAADLAALASAAQAPAGPEAACRSATKVAERMSTTLISCELQGWNAAIRVSARPSGLVERFRVANATARAGPVQTDQFSDGGVRREIHDERSTAIVQR